MEIISLIFLSLMVSVISLTITKARIFYALRKKVDEKNKWLGDLIHCPYCTSHWIALFVVINYHPTVINSGNAIKDGLVSVFSIVAFSTIFSWIIYRSYKGLDLPEDQDQFEEVQMLKQTLQVAKKKLQEQQELIQKLNNKT